ncbi:S41 family peptidase [Pontimicrobium aquaticum]|uniref:S41 family peptidase n=1 Tax=Pontimicrobium aquaticum TaxID=2565367 RepID=UPI0021D2B465|nr:S41 family peptidase [Pontimicrobium aquaticum]
MKINTFTASRTSLKETISKAKIYINKRIEAITSQDQKSLKAWVIDLRNNSGGDMWPMIISLTPFLKDGVLGYTIKNDKENIWKKENGLIYYKGINKTKKYLGKDKSLDYNLKNKNLKIAVLVNERTSSSGEATAIALMNNQNIKFFGTKSRGLTTNNTSIKMKNGDFLVLTTGIWKNFKREEFKTGIIPDFESANEQELKKNIENWINK